MNFQIPYKKIIISTVYLLKLERGLYQFMHVVVHVLFSNLKCKWICIIWRNVHSVKSIETDQNFGQIKL